ncbi:MAG: ROK family protein [Vallitalea sp.]|jgi:glucokinase|nr:ROK family protein [Vallitalea sp.]
MEKNYVIGIDLGGTKISGALSDLDGNLIYKHTIPTNVHEGELSILARIIEVIDKVIVGSKIKIDQIMSIGIGSPGTLNVKTGVIIAANNLPFKNFPLIEAIKQRFDLPIFLDNDANVATIGEHILGAGKGTQNMLYITVSTGIGGGAIINGNIFRGNTDNALGIGHTTIDIDGRKCKCGNNGCIEAYSSGTAIAKLANEAINRGENTSLNNYNVVTAKEVVREAENGDGVAKRVLDFSLGHLGIYIANLIKIFDPEMIVVGGGVSMAGEIIFSKINEVIKENCLEEIVSQCKIIPSKLGRDAGIVGAVALAISKSN